jgi:hypothetical protein
MLPICLSNYYKWMCSLPNQVMWLMKWNWGLFMSHHPHKLRGQRMVLQAVWVIKRWVLDHGVLFARSHSSTIIAFIICDRSQHSHREFAFALCYRLVNYFLHLSLILPDTHLLKLNTALSLQATKETKETDKMTTEVILFYLNMSTFSYL